ncbi:bud site selection protein Bud4p [Diutina catenulata]
MADTVRLMTATTPQASPGKQQVPRDPSSMTLMSSPTQPLSFPLQYPKDANSSSDTYTEHDDSKTDLEPHRGYPLSYPDDAQTPVTSAVNLHTSAKLDDLDDHPPTSASNHAPDHPDISPARQSVRSMPSSPSKSILKTADDSLVASPSKKAVAFHNDGPAVHHYTAESDLSSEQPTTIIHTRPAAASSPSAWASRDVDASHDEPSSPPPPPPHRSPTFESLLSHRDLTFGGPLPPVDLGYPPQMSSPQRTSLDAHLQQLEQAARSNSAHNIHGLSQHLRSSASSLPDPLAASEFHYRSSGSSQSSLQSLRDDNRTLPSATAPSASAGATIPDGGLRRLSAPVLQALVPETHSIAHLSHSPTFARDPSFSEVVDTMQSCSTDDDDHTSFDRSYMSTSQSIMNILNSASNHSLSRHVAAAPRDEVKLEDDIAVKLEDDVKSNDAGSDAVKLEPGTTKLEPGTIKLEPAAGLAVNSERLPRDASAKSELSMHSDAEFAQVSDVGRGHQPRLVETPRVDNTSAESIRLHMDSAWKLEDSHDGDFEDNRDDTNDVTAMSRAPSARRPRERRHSSSSESFEDASEVLDDTPPRSLDPASALASPVRAEFASPARQRSPEARQRDVTYGTEVSSADEAREPEASPAEPAQPAEESRDQSAGDSSNQSARSDAARDDPHALANSSNVAPPGEITLPTVEPAGFGSFEELTTKFDSSAEIFEQSLSAENDPPSAAVATSFLSIWHSQSQKKAPASSSTRSLPKPAPSRVPKQLVTKKFTGVQVVSRRVVSPSHPDFDVTNFLPELSDDSGLEGHFGFLRSRQSSATSHATSRSASRHLSGASVPSRPVSYSRPSAALSSTPSYSLEPPSTADNPASFAYRPPATAPRRSRFRVPTFEIERTSSVLSPKNMYNRDIFETRHSSAASSMAPTITGHGLKTLPSMDGDDVKRILSAKRALTQDEYTHVKLRGPSKMSTAAVSRPHLAYDSLEKHASICNSSYASANDDDDDNDDDDVDDHVAHEVMRTPRALRSSDQFFHDYDLFSDAPVNSLDPSAKNLPEPDADLVAPAAPMFMYADYPLEGSTVMNYERTRPGQPPQPHAVVSPEPAVVSPVPSDPMLYRATTPEQAPPASPRKQRSPLKVVAKNGERIRRKPVGPVEFGAAREPEQVEPPVEVEQPAEQPVEQPVAVDDAVDDAAAPEEPGLPDRGRLFFRVVGLKNVELRDPKSKDAEFTITLDNGVHCIKTAPYKLNQANVMVGKEFELTVLDSLQFILTLKMAYTKPRARLVEVKQNKTVKAKGRLSRLLGSKETVTTTKLVNEPVDDPWATKFAADGSFARCYVDLDQYEHSVTGCAANFNLNCFNEWETVKDADGEWAKAAPYQIGQLEVRMLFVPRTDAHEVLPSSMRQAYESIASLQADLRNTCEGYMYQEGGDCDVLKRRFFKLQGTSLIAHSEFSHKTRAKINLSKVVAVKYVDKENVRTEQFRNFTEVMLLEHAFQIKFANGETIDFGATTDAEKMRWIELIETIIAKNKFRRQPWVKTMLEHAPEPNQTFVPPVGEGITFGGKSKVHSAFPQKYNGQKVL